MNRTLTYPIVSIGLVAGYSLLNWLFIQEWRLLNPKTEVVNFWIPMGLSLFLVTTVLRRRLKTLTTNEKWLDFRAVILWLLLTAPLVVAQHYVETRAGKLTAVDKPSDIESAETSRYYRIGESRALKEYGASWMTRKISSRSGSQVRITCYFVCPVVDWEEDDMTAPRTFNHWMGVKFGETFSNSLLGRGRQSELISAFEENATMRFKFRDFSASYLENIPNSDDKDAFTEAIKRTGLPFDAVELKILTEKTGRYESRADNMLPWIFGTLLAGNLLWLLMLLKAKPSHEPVTESRKKTSVKRRKKAGSEWKENFRLFIPSKQLWASPLIMDANILIFVVMVLSGVSVMNPPVADLIRWGGNSGELTLNGQWWRLLTSMFIHAGIVHVTCNMLVLFIIGKELEQYAGSRKFMLFYLLCGLLASLTSILWHENAVVSVGASGAIFGLFGMNLALALLKYMPGISIKTALFFIGINVVYGLDGSIDMAAHIGGLGTGFLLAMAYFGATKSDLFSKKQKHR